MTTVHKIYVHDKIYVPEAFVDPADAANHYSKRFYDESSCVKCEYLNERHSSSCDTCSAYKGRVVVFNKKRIKGKQYFGFPVGDRKKLEKKIGISFSEFKILDKRVKTPFDYPIKFTLTLRDYQKELTSNFLKRGSYGHMVAPPRSGKTASMLYLSCELGVKTLVIASQHEYLQQYIWHIEGNEAEGIPKCTNLPELEKRVGKKLYGFPKTEEDYATMQIMFMTYQSFISAKGKGRLAKLKPNIGFLQIDEAHQGSATEFSSVIGSIPSRYKCAATGTPDRKDKKDWVMRQLVGPVISKIAIAMLVPEIRLHPTNISPKKHYALWVYAMLFLSKHKERNEMIVAQAIKDVKLGHSIIIPVTFKAHVTLLVDMINKAAGEKIAEPYTGGKGGNKELRKDTLTRVKEGKTKVIVGIRGLVRLGLNVPQWSCLYWVIPSSNQPNTVQEFSRILTPLAGKNTPIIRMFYDEMGQSKGCARNTLRFATSEPLNAKIHKSSVLNAKELQSSKKQQPSEENESTFKSSGTLFGSRRI
jgi:superfamily II DNA or RNA helicase